MTFTLIQQTAPATGSPFTSLIMFVPLILIFYFLIIRPQNQRLKKHRAMLAAVQRNDTIVTSGGLIGKVKKVDEEELTVNFNGTDIKVVKSMIADVRGTKPANDTK